MSDSFVAGKNSNTKFFKTANGWSLTEVERITGGSSSAPFSAGSALNWFEFYRKSTDVSGADSRVIFAYLDVAGAAGSGVAAQFRGEATGTTAITGVGGLDAWGEISATAAMPTGLIYGACAAIIADARAAAASLTGTYWSLFLASSFGTNITTSAQSAFIGCQDWGGGDVMPNFLDVSLLTSGAANAYYAGTHSGSTVGGVLRVNTPAGIMYIKLYSD